MYKVEARGNRGGPRASEIRLGKWTKVREFATHAEASLYVKSWRRNHPSPKHSRIRVRKVV